VFVTIDGSLEHQQNLKKYGMGFVIARVRSNEIEPYEPIFERLKEAAESVRAGEVVFAESGQA
jgi:hypothetical protein